MQSCCVMVLAPCGMALSLRRLRIAARARPIGSRPGWLKKRRSSIASTAFTVWSGSSS